MYLCKLTLNIVWLKSHQLLLHHHNSGAHFNHYSVLVIPSSNEYITQICRQYKPNNSVPNWNQVLGYYWPNEFLGILSKYNKH